MKNSFVFQRVHTAVLLLYLLIILGITVISVNPIISAATVLTAAAAAFVFCDSATRQFVLRFSMPVALLIFAFNFLFNHNGVTVLFYWSDTPFTAEAMLYGVSSAAAFAAAALWFSVFSSIVDTDRIYRLFSGFSKNLAVVFTLAMTLIPRIVEESGHLKQGDSGKKRANSTTITAYMLHLSALFSNVLENSFQTAVSMKARGAMLPKTHQSRRHRLCCVDVLFLVLGAACVFFFFYSGLHRYTIYPIFTVRFFAWSDRLFYISFLLFLLLPLLCAASEEIKWKFIKSKI